MDNMKKIISIGELQRYCETHKPQQIIYLTENQNWHSVANPCRLNLVFSEIHICIHPNLICLKCGDNAIRFDRVRFAEINTDKPVIGTILTLFCGGDDCFFPYTLLIA